MRNVIIVSPINPLRAYSCIVYLAQGLHRAGIHVSLWAWIPVDQLKEVGNYEFEIKSFYSKWYARFPIVRRIFSFFDFIGMCLKGRTVVIVHELLYYPIAVLSKLLKPDIKLVHYHTELFTENELGDLSLLERLCLKFYTAYPEVSDLIIECNKERAAFRKKYFDISSKIFVIPNTIPKSEVPVKKKKLSDYNANIDSRPIVVYSGGVYAHRELDLLLKALAPMKSEVFFFGFCYGDSGAIANFKNQCTQVLGPRNFYIATSVQRREILSRIHEASIGIVYYKPSSSVGTDLAAPTKFFEYIGCGVPIVSSPNRSLMPLIDKYGLGFYAIDESVVSLRQAIKKFVDKPELVVQVRKNEKLAFNSILHYDYAAKATLKEIQNLAES
ncbi:glycosyltransferase [Candidatus Dojkabacteria bacterium]|nr:glycosyltransferase [Candidatus Dojkabacteria bacterium]